MLRTNKFMAGLALVAATLITSSAAYKLTTPALAQMDMPGMAMSAPAPTAVAYVTATINPNPPIVGDNTLNLQVTDAAGQPVTGLKLTASVALATMDMGTTHPVFKQIGSGNYTASVTFNMAGTWKLTLRSGGRTALLTLDAGAKQPWRTPKLPFLGSTPSSKTTPTPPTATMSNSDMAGMNMAAMSMDGDNSHSGTADMMTAEVPQLQQQGKYVATGHEDWKVHTGFGKNAGMVGMMAQMMVGGSGMEGMKMPSMKMDFGAQNYAGDQEDASSASDQAAQASASSAMPAMQMGGSSATPAQEVAQAKQDNSATVPSSASSTDSAAESKPPAATAVASNTQAASVATPIKITGVIANPKSGDNAMIVSIKDGKGTPVTGAKITSSVAMTSMDMGTSHPEFKEIGGGQYRATVNFGMAGPWRVVVRALAPNATQPQKASFDFNAK